MLYHYVMFEANSMVLTILKGVVFGALELQKRKLTKINK